MGVFDLTQRSSGFQGGRKRPRMRMDLPAQDEMEMRGIPAPHPFGREGVQGAGVRLGQGDIRFESPTLSEPYGAENLDKPRKKRPGLRALANFMLALGTSPEHMLEQNERRQREFRELREEEEKFSRKEKEKDQAKTEKRQNKIWEMEADRAEKYGDASGLSPDNPYGDTVRDVIVRMKGSAPPGYALVPPGYRQKPKDEREGVWKKEAAEAEQYGDPGMLSKDNPYGDTVRMAISRLRGKQPEGYAYIPGKGIEREPSEGGPSDYTLGNKKFTLQSRREGFTGKIASRQRWIQEVENAIDGERVNFAAISPDNPLKQAIIVASDAGPLLAELQAEVDSLTRQQELIDEELGRVRTLRGTESPAPEILTIPDLAASHGGISRTGLRGALERTEESGAGGPVEPPSPDQPEPPEPQEGESNEDYFLRLTSLGYDEDEVYDIIADLVRAGRLQEP